MALRKKSSPPGKFQASARLSAQPPSWSPADRRFMALAFAEADKVKGKTLPNPAVGAVLVKRGRVIGHGGTRPAGQAHAEIVALEQAGAKARGSTLYVTLEPCSHYGRTPPCSLAVIAAGVAKVVVAIRDPNPKVGGRGLRQLRRAGLAVRVGLMEEEARERYAGFFFFITKTRPRITVKIAQSLDGRINAQPGTRTAITGKTSQVFSHGLRARVDAILIGAETLRRDNPDLTPRLIKAPPPDVLVLTRGGRLPRGSKIFASDRKSRTVVIGGTGKALPTWVEHISLPTELGEASGAGWVAEKKNLGAEKSAKVDGIAGPAGSKRFALAARGARSAVAKDTALAQALLAIFAERGYHSVLVEGGRSVWKVFLNSGRFDRLFILTAPKLMPKGESWAAVLSRDWGKSLNFRKFASLGTDFLAEFETSNAQG